MNYGDLIKKERKKIGFKQKDLAKRIGISTSYLCNIEKNNRIPSEKIKRKIERIFRKQYTKKELKEMEQEIIETYELMRIEKNPFSKIAVIQRSLIEINKVMEENMIILETTLEPLNQIISKKIERPLKTTIKNFEKNKEKLKKILINEFLIEED